jgi:CRP-like cAMP-binding protein
MVPYLVHVGYALMLCGFLARDILVLRGVLAGAQLVLSTYAFSIAVPSISAWNAVLATINTAWALRILHERRQVHVPLELQEIHRTQFAAMTAGEFLRWWRIGRAEALRGAALTRDGAQPSSLYFIVRGVVQVTRGGALVTELPAGFFVGEMSLITGRPANADVDAVADVQVQQWPRAALDELRARDHALWIKVQSAIGADLVRKIQRGDARVAPK